MSEMRFELTRDPHAFAESAGEFLEQRMEDNVLATVSADLRQRAYAQAAPLFGLGRASDGGLCWAGLRTPPLPMLSTALDPAAALELVRLWLARDPDVPGVNAQPDTARAIAAAWRAHTGGTTSCRLRLAMHAAGQIVDPPFPAPGHMRPATASDRPLLLEWWRAFAREVSVGMADAEASVDARLTYGEILIWEDGGPASMVGVNRP